LEQGHELERLSILQFQPPSQKVLDFILAVPNFIHPHDLQGHVDPNTPSLFVANHTLYGIDMPGLIHGLYSQKGIFVRGLSDHVHFGLPYAPIIRWMGGVDGTRVNAEFLMQHKQHILVYPGGQREVLKHSSIPNYALLWKERMGFARLAIKYGYPIVPVAAVGVEDFLHVVWDLPGGLPLGVVAPWRLQKLYYLFGTPIPTSQYNGEWQNPEIVRRVRDESKAAIQDGIQQLLSKQAQDPERYLTQQVWARIRRRWAGSRADEIMVCGGANAGKKIL
jgi:1-acyl-sn-glycerol-3-phosphate acyltransferase